MNTATAMAAACAPAPLAFSPVYDSKSLRFPAPNSPFLPIRKKTSYFREESYLPRTWKLSAASNDVFRLSEANPVENSIEAVPATGEDGLSTIVSALFFVAFIALSVLTVGVVYIAVTDFLQKRERDKFEKEEEAAKKRKKKKGKAVVGSARNGPRGFGQKVDDDDQDS